MQQLNYLRENGSVYHYHLDMALQRLLALNPGDERIMAMRSQILTPDGAHATLAQLQTLAKTAMGFLNDYRPGRPMAGMHVDPVCYASLYYLVRSAITLTL